MAIVTAEPLLAWASVAALFHPPPPVNPASTRPRSSPPTRRVHPSAEIGPMAVIGERAVIGPRGRIAAAR